VDAQADWHAFCLNSRKQGSAVSTRAFVAFKQQVAENRPTARTKGRKGWYRARRDAGSVHE
jgi:hypothetical protein